MALSPTRRSSFGVKEVLERWVRGVESVESIQAFMYYFHLVRYAALVDIAAFTLMRIDEAASVRWNCLRWFDDPVFGRIPLIQAETTKTDPDDNGLWITSPSIEPAIQALQSIAKLRLSSVEQWSEESNPALITAVLEPWGAGRKSAKQAVEAKPSVASFAKLYAPIKCCLTLKNSRLQWTTSR